jgi:hypothetical protein
MVGVQGEWIIKKRNCAVPLNNRVRKIKIILVQLFIIRVII